MKVLYRYRYVCVRRYHLIDLLSTTDASRSDSPLCTSEFVIMNERTTKESEEEDVEGAPTRRR